MQHLKDPAAGLPPQLLPHLHLVSKYRYPTVSQMSIESVVNSLVEASKIMRDLQPVQWQFLEAPPDGSLFLTWQPLEYLDTSFASDGYIWADVEQVFSQEAHGYTLETFWHRAGFKPGEPVACHARRRYRLMPSKNPTAPVAPADPSLFLILYLRAERRDSIPFHSVPVTPQAQTMMQQRQFLKMQGQLPRKEFMLHDRANWPTVHPPGGHAPFPHAQSLANNVARQQHMAMMAGQQQGVMAGRAGPVGHVRGRSGNIMAQEVTIEEEEDVSRGDMLDFLTPRDISKLRYEQHHEWMEEVVNSVYDTNQIIPSDLGLGRKGELEALTNGFFDAPLGITQESAGGLQPPRVGRMDGNKADMFTKKALQKVTEMQADLEKMKEKHSRRMAKLRKTTVLNSAERRLRAAPDTVDERGHGDDEIKGENTETVDDVAQEIEISCGLKVVPTKNVTCVQEGGLERKPSASATQMRQPSLESESPRKATDGGQSVMATLPAPASNEPTAASQHPVLPDSGVSTGSLEASPGALNNDGACDSTPDSNQRDNGEHGVPSLDDMDVDIEMAGLDSHARGSEDEGGAGSEWVIVDEQGGNGDNEEGPSDQAPSFQQLQGSSLTPEQGGATPGVVTQNPQTDVREGVVTQPGVDSPALENAFDVDDGFDDLNTDTAGDALADYGDENDLNLDVMEDSAFGDAFHPPEEAEFEE